MAKVVILFERSGIVRDAFIRAGHDAISVDLKPTASPGPHHCGDVFEFMEAHGNNEFDLMVAHPVCQYLTNAAAWCLYNKDKTPDIERWHNMVNAALDFKRVLEWKGVRCKVVENPVMHGYAKQIIGSHQTQSIQPYEFGADASKRTCLWLRYLPKLLKDPGNYVQPRIVNGKKRWANQTDSGQNRLGPSPDRADKRAETYPGIARALAEQYGRLLAPAP